MSEKYEELARSARCLAGSTTTPNWNAAKAVFQATCTPYTIMEITEDFDRVTAERDETQACLELSIGREDALQQRLTAADERADVLEGALRELLAGTGNSPGANRKYGKARAVLAGSQKQAAPEPYQGIPGTSFQRLNSLANQGE